MKTSFLRPRRSTGFTLVEVMISMTIVSMVMAMCMSTFLFGLRAMYKDTQRLATNANLRSFMAQRPATDGSKVALRVSRHVRVPRIPGFEARE